jgi:hypothetical protein
MLLECWWWGRPALQRHCAISLDDLGAFVHHGWKEVVAAVTSVRGRGEGISTPRSQALTLECDSRRLDAL